MNDDLSEGDYEFLREARDPLMRGRAIVVACCLIPLVAIAVGSLGYVLWRLTHGS